MYVALMVVAVIIAGTGFALIFDGYRHRASSDLTERLAPFQPSVSDEAEVWLRRQ